MENKLFSYWLSVGLKNMKYFRIGEYRKWLIFIPLQFENLFIENIHYAKAMFFENIFTPVEIFAECIL